MKKGKYHSLVDKIKQKKFIVVAYNDEVVDKSEETLTTSTEKN